MNMKARKENPAQPPRRAAMRFVPDGADYMGKSGSHAWKLARTDDDFKATVTLFKVGNSTMVMTEDLDCFLALKKAKGTALQSERMARLRAHRAKHAGEFDAAKVTVDTAS